MKKRNIILLVMVFLLLTFFITKKTQAAELTEPLTFQINDFTYSVITVATDASEGSVRIVSYKGTENSLVLPSTVTYEDKVYKVTEITGWGAIYDLPTLEKLTIPASIEFIANNTIIANLNLESIIFLGSTPPTFGEDSSVSAVVIHKAEMIIYVPHNSVTLYRNALASKVEYSYSPGSDLYEAGYKYMRVIAIDYNDPQPALIEEDGVLYHVTKKATVDTPGTVSLLGIQAYSSLSRVSNISLSGSVTYNGLAYTLTKLEQTSFCGHRYQSIIVPNSVKYLGKWVFDYDLEKLILSNNIKDIPTSFLAQGEGGNCNLKYIALPKDLTTIGKNAFTACKDLANITFRSVAAPANITVAFNYDLVKNIYVPASGLSNYKAAFSKQIKAGTVKVLATNKIDDILFSMLP